jgi:hypothetical protein
MYMFEIAGNRGIVNIGVSGGPRQLCPARVSRRRISLGRSQVDLIAPVRVVAPHYVVGRLLWLVRSAFFEVRRLLDRTWSLNSVGRCLLDHLMFPPPAIAVHRSTFSCVPGTVAQLIDCAAPPVSANICR